VRAIVIPVYGALDLVPGGHRKAIHEEPVGEGLSKLKPFVRVLEIPLMGREGRVELSSRAMRHAICSPQDPSGRHVAELRKEEARMEQLTGMWPERT